TFPIPLISYIFPYTTLFRSGNLFIYWLLPMKNLFVIFLMIGLAGSLLGDIQDPPANDYGPTRKLGRGFSNFFLAPAEVFVTVTTDRKSTRLNSSHEWSSYAV